MKDPLFELLARLGTKVAFSTSQYSGPLNPDIRSGASVLPPFKAPQLRAAIQKNGGAVTPKVGPANGDLTKAGASAPTRGNFMQASDIPSFKWPQLRVGIQKDSGSKPLPSSASVDTNPMPENTSKYAAFFKHAKAYFKLEGDAVIETDKGGKSLGKGPQPEKDGRVSLKDKDADFLPGTITANSSDFKRSKYSMPLSDMAAFVAELRKEAGMNTPASQLAKTQSIGAPKASPPPGPSIAQIAKPRGARFGVGIPGAFKSRIGGDAGVSLS